MQIKQEEEKRKENKKKKDILLEWRGAGTGAYFYLGAWNILAHLQSRGKLNFSFRGISSGSLMATLAICRLDLQRMVDDFDFKVRQEYDKFKSKFTFTFTFKLLSLWPWTEAKIRFSLIPSFIKQWITDEMVAKYCDNGKLTIIAFDLLTMKVIEKNKWSGVDELIDWICGTMTIPGVTDKPRWVQTNAIVNKNDVNDKNANNINNNETRQLLLVDPMSLPCAHKHSLVFSPLCIEECKSHIHPKQPLPSLLSLFQLSPEIKNYLISQGQESVLRFLSRQLFLYYHRQALTNVSRKNEDQSI